MELRHLEYFVAIAAEKNINHAASHLNISQPSLTRQIQQLEEELGAELLIRTYRSVELTDAGRNFLSDARKILSEIEEAKKRARRASRGKPGQLGIGTSGTAILDKASRNLTFDVELCRYWTI